MSTALVEAVPFPRERRTDLAALAAAIVRNLATVVHGQGRAIELAVTALLAGGHVLVEDVPGTGKTVLARALARSVAGDFRRVQATADLLPADLTGSSVLDPAAQTFRFVPGPVFANVLLVDELNRTSPRTQSGLMEAMEEGAVTVDGVRHPLPDPFLLIATQNPREHHGTYPLPEGQLDRFAVAFGLGHVDHRTERTVVREQLAGSPVDLLAPVVTAAQLRLVRDEARATHVADAVLDHALAVVRATRTHSLLEAGASSRAALSLVRCAQARALLHGRDYVVPDDVKVLAPPVLGHRVTVRADAPDRLSGARVVAELTASVPVPVPA